MQNLPDYHEQQRLNKQKFMETLGVAYPELFVVAKMMDEIDFNPVILFHTMNHVSEIARGTGFGQVHIVLEDKVVRFVRGEHSTKLNEPVFQSQKEQIAKDDVS